MNEKQLLPLLKAASFAARVHRHQVRKDGETPYVGHVYRVCLIVQQVFGIHDADVLTASLLHDTIEDTTTDYDAISEVFGEQIANWVACLSKDKRQVEVERETAYMHQLAAAPWQVQVCKLADVMDNLLDSESFHPAKRRNTFNRAHAYLAAFENHISEQARKPFALVTELLHRLEKESK